MSKTMVKFAGQKFYKKDFREYGTDFVEADLRGISAIECIFDDLDMSLANCERGNFYKSSFVNTKLHRTNMKDAILACAIMKPRDCFNLAMTLNCTAFNGMKISKELWLQLLYIALIVESPDQIISDKIIAAIGADDYARLHLMFKNRTV